MGAPRTTDDKLAGRRLLSGVALLYVPEQWQIYALAGDRENADE